MAPSSTKNRLSPSELSQLEHAFAADPSSEAYRPLAEAYLGMGRFMEAMVVCKKGIKAHPDDASPRVLLARIYSEQGKDRKALEELQGALQIAPQDAGALRMNGDLLCKTGDLAQGAEQLKKALSLDPRDAVTLAVCQKHNISLAAAAPAAPIPQAVPDVVAVPPALMQVGAGAPAQAPRGAARAGAPPGNGVAAQAGQASAAPGLQAAPSGLRPAPRPRPQPSVSYDELAAKYGEAEDAGRHHKKGGLVAAIVTLTVVLAGALGLGGYYIKSKNDAAAARKIDRLLKQMQEEISHDSYAGYKKACEYGETIISELDNKLFSAHAYLAYAYAIRWGEHGEGDRVEKAAREHLERAKAAKTEHSHLIASEAYITFFSGDAAKAQTDLERTVQDYETRGKKSALLLSTLGILQMYGGDLDNSFKNIKAAQTMAPADARISAALGNVLRRQGNEFLAANAFEGALRYEKDHAEAQLGVALMAIDSATGTGEGDQAKFATADRLVKRLLGADPPPSIRQLAMARMLHAIILDEQSKQVEADKEQQLALDSDARNGELFILKGRRMMRQGKGDEAVAAIREAIKLEPKRASFYVDLAKALTNRPGGAKEAADSITKALATMPSSTKLLVLLGDAYVKVPDYENARQSYEKAMAAANGKLPEARMALADLARIQKDYPRALELFEKARNEYVTSVERQAYAETRRGEVFEEQGDKKKALDTYKEASGIDPTFAPPYFLIGRLFANDKTKREAAGKLFEKYLELAPRGEYADQAKKFMEKAK